MLLLWAKPTRSMRYLDVSSNRPRKTNRHDRLISLVANQTRHGITPGFEPEPVKHSCWLALLGSMRQIGWCTRRCLRDWPRPAQLPSKVVWRLGGPPEKLSNTKHPFKSKSKSKPPSQTAKCRGNLKLPPFKNKKE